MMKTAIKKQTMSYLNEIIWLARGANNRLHGYLPSKDIPIKEKETLVILMNGPSPKGCIEKNLNWPKADYMCVNFFPCNSEQFCQLRPKYLCITDSEYLAEEDDKTKVQMKKLRRVLETVDWNMQIFLYPFQTLGLTGNQFVKEQYVNCNEAEIERVTNKWKKRFDRNRAIPVIHNIAVFALFNAIRMNYRRILIYGLDMSFHMSLHVNKQNHILQEVSHYYGKEKIDITKKDRKNQKKMEQLFFEWYQAFKGFRLMKEYAEFKRIKILNMNPDSYVDIFIKTCREGGKEYENSSIYSD